MAWCRLAQGHLHPLPWPVANGTRVSHADVMAWVRFTGPLCGGLHQPRLWFITGGYLVKRWFIPAAARARGQPNDLNREILASNLFDCHKAVINAPPVPSISRCIHIVYRHKNVWEYQWSNFIYNCMSTFLHYVRCKDALLDCSAPGGERCESLTWVDEIHRSHSLHKHPAFFVLFVVSLNKLMKFSGIAVDLRSHDTHVTVMSLGVVSVRNELTNNNIVTRPSGASVMTCRRYPGIFLF